MLMTVTETPEFIASVSRIWSEAERHDFIDWIADNPDSGDVIPGSGGLRKVRWSAQGKGKRGGARVVYFIRTQQGDLVLVTAYTKGRIENIPAHLLRSLMEKFNV
ncbi:transcriptional regulator [Amphibiibacter pelophylacis]|uniref:Transcriptional regulator n=1 Tax=Amphibiibacter pelophylacis TaxID=1799477 RepID=A0ACC6NZ59_9BURK